MANSFYIVYLYQSVMGSFVVQAFMLEHFPLDQISPILLKSLSWPTNKFGPYVYFGASLISSQAKFWHLFFRA